MNAVKPFLTAIIIARAGYAALLFLSVLLYKLGVDDLVPVSDQLFDFITSLSWGLTFFWGFYVACYVAAGVLITYSSHWALWTYILAMFADFSAWIFITTYIHYGQLLAGNSDMIDLAFIIADFSILLTLAALTYFRVLR